MELLWAGEVRHYCRGVPVVLVGNKLDLREKSSPAERATFLTTDQGKSAAHKIKATRFVECSAKTKAGIDTVFQVAAKAAVAMRNNNKIVSKITKS